MFGRMLLAAFVAVGGAIGAGMVIGLPLALLGELQVISFRALSSPAIGPIMILGALWGVAHWADNIAEYR